MNCELCGKDSGILKKTLIEGSTLSVCAECARFGTLVQESAVKDQKGPLESSPVSKKRWVGKDVFEEASKKELAVDYPQRIKRARLSKGWTPEEFGKVINEKRSIITKLESGELKPDERLTSKLQRTLNIKLMEDVEDIKVKAKKKKRPTYLGDVVKIK